MLRSFFDYEDDTDKLPPYFTIGANVPKVGTAAMDSSDQAVVTFDEHTGVAACRSGINIVGNDQEIRHRDLGEIVYVVSNPNAPVAEQLRSKLSLEQSFRLLTGRRPFYSSLKARSPLIPPRAVAASVRIVEDYRRLHNFSNSIYALPGMLFMADGRLNAQNYPGPQAIDELARLLRARGIRYVGLTKSGMLFNAVRRNARAIRRLVGEYPFAFSIRETDLRLAYRNDQTSSTPKTIRHGSSSSALGGVGAIRFGLSISGDHLTIVEMSLYDIKAFSGLILTHEPLEHFINHQLGRIKNPAVYSWDVLRFVELGDWEDYIIPTLEEIVYSAYTDTELGIYPRALADIHNHIKLRFDNPELEAKRRQIIKELAASGIPVESIPIVLDGPHKTDPDEYNAYAPFN